MNGQSESHITNITTGTRATLRLAADDLTMGQVADALGISYEAAKKRLQRFREEHEFNRYAMRSWARDHRECCLCGFRNNSQDVAGMSPKGTDNRQTAFEDAAGTRACDFRKESTQT